MTETQVRIRVTTSGQEKLERLAKSTNKVDAAVDKISKKLPGAANGISRFGRASSVASKGVKTFGLAVKAALGPIALFTSAVGVISGAFNTLSQQDFAEAKVRTLGVNSEELRQRLVALSAELKGTASVVELTAASYDVASAGFNSAAEATEVLKAAQLGATGGFADLNTVANATTSVLNAYGLSADKAGGLVDQFIQTQNDGKIVVAEYAANIGKVAAAAAGLGIPLAEVNAAIAQSTASGVQAEVAFTGLKSALARLASGEASKALKDFGIEITAASLKSDGLVGTLQKLVDAGLDTGQIFKALGTEAAPALLPLINNLEKTKELVENQKNAAGASAKASKEASDTIQGALTRLTSAFQNAFAEQTALGQAFKASILVVAIAVEELTKFVNFLVRAFKALAALLSPLIKLFADLLNKLKPTAQQTERLRGAAETAGRAVIGFANAIGGLIQRVVRAIPVVGQLYSLLSSFQLLDPGAAAEAFSAPTAGPRKVNYQQEIQDAIKAQQQLEALQSGLTGPAVSGGGGGGGGGSASADNSEAEARARQLQAAKDLLRVSENQLKIDEAISDGTRRKLEAISERSDIEARYSKLIEERKSKEEEALLIAARDNELRSVAVKLERDLKDLKESAVGGIKEEIKALEAKIAGKTREYEIEKKIAELRAKGVPQGEAESLVNRLDGLQKEAAMVEKLDQLYAQVGNTIADGIVAGITDAIEGGENLQKILSDTLKSVGKLLINAGVRSIGGGIGIPGFADGGIAPAGMPSLVGERGPELITPLTPVAVSPFTENGASLADQVGNAAGADAVDAFDAAAQSLGTQSATMMNNAAEARSDSMMQSEGKMTIETQVINSVEYATVDQVRKASSAAAKTARARVFSDLKNKPTARGGIGL